MQGKTIDGRKGVMGNGQEIRRQCIDVKVGLAQKARMGPARVASFGARNEGKKALASEKCMAYQEDNTNRHKGEEEVGRVLSWCSVRCLMRGQARAPGLSRGLTGLGLGACMAPHLQHECCTPLKGNFT